MIAIWKRELGSFFKSPVGYVYLFLYLIVSGYIFSLVNLQGYSSDVSGYFMICSYLLIIVIPLLTMKLFPEERKNKTDQILITAPVSITGIVMGKFMAAYSMFLISLIPSIPMMIFLSVHGNVEFGILISNYVGILLVGAAYLSIGMLLACVTESQIIAFMMGFFTLLFFSLCELLKNLTSIPLLDRIIDVFSVTTRYVKLSSGLFDFSAIFYFISLTVVFLFLIVRIIDKRRWS